jgi:hypothetical protein
MRQATVAVGVALRIAAIMLTAVTCAIGVGRSSEPIDVRRVRELRILPSVLRACPSQRIVARYVAVLDSGVLRQIDPEAPGLLDRSGTAAAPRRDGTWATDSEPLESAHTGFRLRAQLRENPAIAAETTVAPAYDCLPRVARS